MEEVFKRVKELKLKALDIVEQKMQYDITISDLKILSECINDIAEDKNLYGSTLIKMLNTTNNKSLASGFSNMPKENETKSE